MGAICYSSTIRTHQHWHSCLLSSCAHPEQVSCSPAPPHLRESGAKGGARLGARRAVEELRQALQGQQQRRQQAALQLLQQLPLCPQNASLGQP